jgi:VCBS repeat-containing protein
MATITGTNAADTITTTVNSTGGPRATSGADYIEGLGGGDFISSGGGNDTIVGGAGDDIINGQTGTGDVAVYGGDWSQYTITVPVNPTGGYTVTGIAGTAGAADGSDTVTNIEILSFGSGDVSLADAINDAPTVADPVFDNTHNEDSAPFTVDLLSNVTDLDLTQVGSGAGLEVLSIKPGTAALVTNVGWAGTVTYAINNATGELSIDPHQFNSLQLGQHVDLVINYTVQDAHGLTVTNSATISIEGRNEAPELTGTIATLPNGSEDHSFTVTGASLLAGWTDADSDTPLFATELAADHGTVSGPDEFGNYTVTPAANYSGPVVLSYSVTDGIDPVAAHLTVQLAPVADAPVLTLGSGGGLATTQLIGANVVVFDNGAYVDTFGGAGSESDTIQASLASLGHTVTAFNGIDAASFTAALIGQQVLVIPELEIGNLVLDAAARTVVQQFVSNGGTIVIGGDQANGDEDLVNALFGFNVQQGDNYSGPYALTGAAAGTTFAGDAASIPGTYDGASGTYTYTSASLPAGSRDIYTDGTNSAVSLMPYGSGQVVHLSYDWYNAAPLGTQNGGWLTVLNSAISTARPPVTAAEDTADISLGTITASTPDTDGSETVTLTLTGFPAGATFSVGASDGHGGWLISGATLATTPLTMTPPHNYDGHFTLGVTATTTDAATGFVSTTASTSSTMAVTITPVSDAPAITVHAASGDEDTAIALDFSAAVTDASETITAITVSNIPVDAVLTDGHGHTFTASAGHQSVDVTAWTLSSVTITPPQDFHGSFNLSVAATSQDGTAAPVTSDPVTLSVTVASVNDAPVAHDDVYVPAPVEAYLGSYRVDQGVYWLDGSLVYSATEAAAYLFGGTSDDYDISTSPSLDPNTITHTGWYTIYAVGADEYEEDYRLDTGALGYESSYDGIVSSDISAYTRDNANGEAYTNYVWHFVTPPPITEDNVTAISAATLLANDTDVEHDVLSIASVSALSAHGATVTLNGATIHYDPTGAHDFQALNAGDSLTDTFEYTISDSHGGFDTATVTLTVNGINDAPDANADVADVGEDHSVTGNVISALLGGVSYGNPADTFASGDGIASNTSTTATLNGTSASGTLNTTNDHDWFRVQLVAGTPYTFNLNGTGGSPVPDTFLYLLNATGGYITGDDNSGPGFNSQLTFTPTTSGTYYLDAASYANSYSGTYTLSVSPPVNVQVDVPTTGTDTDVDNTLAQLHVTAFTIDTDEGPVTGIVGEPIDLDFGFGLGPIGTFVMNANGSWLFTPTEGAQLLAEGDVNTAIVTYTLSDGTAETALSNTATLTLTIAGTNDIPQITVHTAPEGPLFEDTFTLPGLVQATGDLDIVDVDLNQSFFRPAGGPSANPALVGDYGTLAIDSDGTWTYTLNNAAANVQQLGAQDHVTDHITVQALDGTQYVIAVNIQGTNDAVSITAAVVATPTLVDTAIDNAFANVTGTLADSVTDVDTNDAYQFWINSPDATFDEMSGDSEFTGTYGTLTVHLDGTYSYAPNAAAINGLQSGAHAEVFDVAVYDGTAENSTTLTFNITAANDTPEITAVVATLVDTADNDTFANVTGVLNGSDRDADATLLYGLVGDESGVNALGTLTVSEDGHYTFVPNAEAINALQAGDYTAEFQVYVWDGNTEAVTTSTLTINVTAGNDTPEIAAVEPIWYNDTSASDTFAPIGGTLVGADRDTDAVLTYALEDGAIRILGDGRFSVVETEFGGLSVNMMTGAYAFFPHSDAINALAVEQFQSLTFNVIVTDNAEPSASSTTPIVVNIVGSNDTPTIDVVTAAALTDTADYDTFEPVTGTLVGHDVDNGAWNYFWIDGGSYDFETFLCSSTSDYGTLSVDVFTGDYTFTPNDLAINALNTGETIPVTFSVSVVDEYEAYTSTPLVINIERADDTAIITGDFGGAVFEDGTVATGFIGAFDIDNDSGFGEGEIVGGVYGSLAIDGAGHWTYTLSNDSYSVQSLDQGATVSDPIVVHTLDGTAVTINVEVTGTNDGPVIRGALQAGLAEDQTTWIYDSETDSYSTSNLITLSLLNNNFDRAYGSGVTDADANSVLHVVEGSGNLNWLPDYISVQGDKIVVDTRGDSYVQAMGANTSQTMLVTYQVTDEHGAYVNQTMVLTIEGTNDAPIVEGEIIRNAEEDTGLMVVNLLDGAGDIDWGDHLSIDASEVMLPSYATIVGNNVVINTNDAAFQSLSLDGEPAQFVLNYLVMDQNYGWTPQTATINISGSNDAPMVTATTADVIENDVVTGTFAGTDIDAGETAGLVYALTGEAPAGFSFEGDSWSFDASGYSHLAEGQTLVLNIPYTATDAHDVTSAPATLTITITGTNNAPAVTVAEIAAITEDTGIRVVNLLAGVSDAEGQALTVSNVTVDAGDGPEPLPAFVTLAGGSLVFDTNAASLTAGLGEVFDVTLTYDVTDSQGATSQVTRTFTLNGANDAPVVGGPIPAASATAGAGGLVSINALANVTDLDDVPVVDGVTGARDQLVVIPPGTLPAGVAFNPGNPATHTAPTFSLNPADPAFAGLAVGQTQTIVVDYMVSDGVAAPVANHAVFHVTGAYATINGTPQHDELNGTAASEAINGLGADDLIWGGAGADRIDGGDGVNTASYQGSAAGVSVNLGTNVNTGGDAQGDLLFNIANVVDSAHDDTLVGNSDDNRFTYTNGLDTYNGQRGADTVDYSQFASAVWVDLTYHGHAIAGYGDHQAWTRDGSNLAPGAGDWRAIGNLSSIENVVASGGSDAIWGNDQGNSFTYSVGAGGGGMDRYYGGGGSDTADYSQFTSAVWVDLTYHGDAVYGNHQAWTRDGSNLTTGTWREITDLQSVENLDGTRFDDILRGDDNANILRGGAGSDVLVGRGGSDTFAFEDGDSIAGHADVIGDWQNGIDVIDLISVSTVGGFADLSFTSASDGTHITGAGLEIIVHGTTPDAFDESDFYFHGA